ncbi:MAG: hypothetical protein AABZ55_03965 [Bdellovibrionota bacterium]
MTLLHDSVDSKKFDVRMVERNLTRGVVTADDFEKSLKKLPDDEDNADWTSLDELTDEDEDDEDEVLGTEGNGHAPTSA